MQHTRLVASSAVLAACGGQATPSIASITSSDGGTGAAGDPDATTRADGSFPAPPPPPGLPHSPVNPDASNDPSSASSPAADPVVSGDPAQCGLSACAGGQPCPDLTVDVNELAGSILVGTRQFDDSSCAIVEGCVTQTGTRRLLMFDTAMENIGKADLVVGNPTQNACFKWSACHQHYHFRGVGRYTLYQQDGTTVAAVGHKQGYCIDDTYAVPGLGIAPAVPSAELFDCTSNQGLHVGFEDVYPNNIDCQWIDVTGLPAGTYILSVLVNGDHYLPESDYTNNEARVKLTLPAP
jgi:hypothetical protein